MKPIPAVLLNNAQTQEIFKANEIKLPRFSGEFHFHEDCQLVYIIKSSGKRVIGDLVESFDSGELIFMGSNLPHVWHNTQNEKHNVYEEAHSLSLYFNPNELLKHLSAFGQVNKLESFLKLSQRGIQFEGACKNNIINLLHSIVHQDGLNRIITLLNIIDHMVIGSEYKLLASINYINYYQYQDSKRMDQVFKYIFDNFKQEIPLETIAGVASMNASAFCRYFKTRTQKSFVAFVNEMRIGYACKLLNDYDHSISNIAYECGFNNISNFNRIFKLIKKISPRDYRNQLYNAAFES